MEPTEVVTERVVKELLMGKIGGGGNAKIEVKGADGWVTAGMISLALLAAASIYAASDARAEVRTMRTENAALRAEFSGKIDAMRSDHEADAREFRQRDNALQAYINAGMAKAAKDAQSERKKSP